MPDASLARETILRPEAGLARGVWEAPAWAFLVVAIVVAAGLALYLVHLLRTAGARS